MDAYFCGLITHEQYMQRCLQLAAKGAGSVAPNPMVGAVLVYEGRIIGEGYHQQYGGPHAELNCITHVLEAEKQFLQHSTMYVSLEPCAHFGKTPPCADLIVENKISHVVIGCRDSFAEVDGKGIEKLRAAGIKVEVGILESECIELNKRFFTFHEQLRPYIILKWAQTSDGFIAAAGSARTFISTEVSNRLVHKWRSEEAAILVGTNTALQDNPSLTTRLWPGNNPLRLVIDKDLQLPASLKLFDGSAKTIVFNYKEQSGGGNLIYQQLNRDEDVLQQILSSLYRQQIQSLIVEGGSKLLQSFIDAGLWDEARVITNTGMMLSAGVATPALKNEKLLGEEKAAADIVSFFGNESKNRNWE